jgi:cytoskeletal protein RodZ
MLAHMLKYVSLLALVAGLFIFGIIAFTWYNARSAIIIPPDPNNKTLTEKDLGIRKAGVGPGKERPSKAPQTTAPEVKKESTEQKSETTTPDGKKESSEKKSETTPANKQGTPDKKPQTTPADKQGTPDKKPESPPSPPEKK